MERKIISIIMVLSGVLILSGFSTTEAYALVSDFYWSDSGSISTADAVTKNVVPVAGGFVRVGDVELDPLANKLWWNNWVVPPGGSQPTEGIYKSNPDGTAQVQVTTVAQSNSLAGKPSGLHGLVLDPANQKVFFTRGVSYAQGPQGWGEVSSINMDGTGYTQLNTPGAESWFPSGIELSGNTLYWGQPGVILSAGNADGAVNSMDTSGGSIMLNVVPHTDGHGRSLAVDAAKSLLFYSTFNVGDPLAGGEIFVVDLITGATAAVFTDLTTGIPDIELDTADMRIYWTDYANGEIVSASYDATGTLGVVTTEISNLGNPFGLALEFVQAQAVGGSDVSINTSALLLAGVQSITMWMIPVVIAGVGIGVFVIKRRN